MSTSLLICPVCHSALAPSASGLSCINLHQFDRAKQGYFNLLPVQHKHSKNPGDTPESLLSRRAFLADGWYAPLQQALQQLAVQLAAGSAPLNWLDLGCGEGYYTISLIPYVQHMVGVDIAKKAVALAAKKAQSLDPHIPKHFASQSTQGTTANNHNNHNHPADWLVASSHKLPIASASIQVVSSIFAPTAEAEAARVLADRGWYIIVRPHAQHLLSFRQALFSHISASDYHTAHAQLNQHGFVLQSCTTVVAPMLLPACSVSQLIDMTPYTYKASLTAKQTLILAAQHHPLATEAKFRVELWQYTKPTKHHS